MPPGRLSRHRFSDGQTDDSSRFYLSDRSRFEYRDLPDNRQHVVKEGDSLFNLAGRYYSGFARGAGFWWVIADFNGVHDPTIELVPGTILTIPSTRTVQEQILNERRRNE